MFARTSFFVLFLAVLAVIVPATTAYPLCYDNHGIQYRCPDAAE